MECEHKKIVILDDIEVDEELKDVVKLLEKKDIHVIHSCQESHGKSYLDFDLSDYKEFIYKIESNPKFWRFIKKCSMDLSFSHKKRKEKDEKDDETEWTVSLWFKPTDIKYIVESLKAIK
jgi:hypothetical protein